MNTAPLALGGLWCRCLSVLEFTSVRGSIARLPGDERTHFTARDDVRWTRRTYGHIKRVVSDCRWALRGESRECVMSRVSCGGKRRYCTPPSATTSERRCTGQVCRLAPSVIGSTSCACLY